MTTQAVTFDCGMTLLGDFWDPPGIACDVAEAAGIELDRQVASEIYTRLLAGRMTEYRRINHGGDHSEYQRFWIEHTRDWLDQIGEDTSRADELYRKADDRIFNPASGMMTLFDDVVPCLEELQSRGLKLGIISNWDMSLERALTVHDLTKWFDPIIASMVVGSEKPAKQIFDIAAEGLDTPHERIIHVGDNPLDDGQGARDAGYAGCFIIDREHQSPGGHILSDLRDLADRLP